MQDTRPSIGGQRNVQCRGVTDDFCGNRTPVWKSASAHLPQAANFHGHCIGSVVEVFFIFLFETFATIYSCDKEDLSSVCRVTHVCARPWSRNLDLSLGRFLESQRLHVLVLRSQGLGVGLHSIVQSPDQQCV